MSNQLQQQIDNMTPDQAIGLMAQTMSSVQGSRADHMLLAKAEDLIIGLVKAGLEANRIQADSQGREEEPSMEKTKLTETLE